MFKNKYPLPDDADSKTSGDSAPSPPPVARAMAKARMKPDFTLFDVPRPHQSRPTPGNKTLPEPTRPEPTRFGSPDADAPFKSGLLRRAVGSLAKGLLTALLLIWIFILGVLVGRHNFFELPEVHQLADTIEDLAQQAVNMVMPSRTEPAPAANQAAPPEGLAAEAPAPAFSVETESTVSKGVPQAMRGANAITGLNSFPDFEEPANGESATEAPPASQLDSTEEPAAPPQALKQYSVRILSTNSPALAAELMDRLKAQGYNPYSAEVSGLYNVRVGRYATYDEARSIREKLESEGYDGPYISIDN